MRQQYELIEMPQETSDRDGDLKRRGFLGLAGTALAGLAFGYIKRRIDTAGEVLESIETFGGNQETGGEVNGILLDIPVLSQWDSRWAGALLGYNSGGALSTIGDVGCLLVSETMLARAFDSNTAKTPLTIQQTLLDADVFKDGNGNPNAGFQRYELAERVLGFRREATYGAYNEDVPTGVLTVVRDTLTQGKPVLIEVHLTDTPLDVTKPSYGAHQQHFCVLTGWSYDTAQQSFTYIFNDPWTGTQRILDESSFAHKAYTFYLYNQPVDFA